MKYIRENTALALRRAFIYLVIGPTVVGVYQLISPGSDLITVAASCGSVAYFALLCAYHTRNVWRTADAMSVFAIANGLTIGAGLATGGLTVATFDLRAFLILAGLGTVISFPAILILTLVLRLPLKGVRVFLEPGHCPVCGYCLSGLSSRICPECGNAFSPHDVTT